MDAKQFDLLARTLVGSAERRAVLRALAALSLTGAATLLTHAEGEGKRLRHGRRASHRPGKDKDNRKGKRTGRKPGRRAQAACAAVMTASGCRQVQESSTTVWSCPNGAQLSGVDLSGCDLHGARLLVANLSHTLLNKTILNNANLNGSQLHEAPMIQATMVEAHLVQTNLGGADLREADMRRVDFTLGTLNSAKLPSARMDGAIFQNTDLRGAQYHNTVCPDGALTRPEGSFGTNDCCGHLNGYTTPLC